MTAPALPPVPGELLPPTPTRPYSPPQGGLDLTYRIWATLTWPRVLQVVVLLLAVAAIAAGLGTVLPAVPGSAGLWTVLGGATGAGAGAHALRRRAARRRGQR